MAMEIHEFDSSEAQIVDRYSMLLCLYLLPIDSNHCVDCLLRKAEHYFAATPIQTLTANVSSSFSAFDVLVLLSKYHEGKEVAARISPWCIPWYYLDMSDSHRYKDTTRQNIRETCYPNAFVVCVRSDAKCIEAARKPPLIKYAAIKFEWHHYLPPGT